MNPRVLSVLEYDKVRERLAERTAFAARREAARGVVLDPEVLLEVRDTLESGAYVRNVLSRYKDDLPLLSDLAGTIEPCPVVLRAIRDAIGERGEVLHSASPELGKIRSQLRVAYNRMMDALERIMRAAADRGLLQESIIT